jgi:hypothetical protein
LPLEFTKTVCKCSLVERLDPLSMAVLLMIQGNLSAQREKSVKVSGHLPSRSAANGLCSHDDHTSHSLRIDREQGTYNESYNNPGPFVFVPSNSSLTNSSKLPKADRRPFKNGCWIYRFLLLYRSCM